MKRQVNKNIILLITLFILIIKEGKAQPESTTEDLGLRPKIEYKSADLKDPFLPPKREEQVEDQIRVIEEQIPVVPLPELTIQGVVWGSGLPQAIINNKVLRIEDTIEGVRIIDIDKDGVTVSFGNREYNLPSPATVSVSALTGYRESAEAQEGVERNLIDFKKSGGIGYEK